MKFEKNVGEAQSLYAPMFREWFLWKIRLSPSRASRTSRRFLEKIMLKPIA
jgi:hypothetical protein